MPGTVSKTDNFLKAIEKYAEEQRSKIQSEAEDFRERELSERSVCPHSEKNDRYQNADSG